MERAQHGDQQAWKMLIQQYSGKVFLRCKQILGNEHLAEDAAQDAWLSAYHKLAACESNFGGWLFTIATNKAFDMSARETRLSVQGLRRPRGDKDPVTVLPADDASGVVQTDAPENDSSEDGAVTEVGPNPTCAEARPAFAGSVTDEIPDPMSFEDSIFDAKIVRRRRSTFNAVVRRLRLAGKFTDDQWAVLELGVQGYTDHEIANILGKNYDNIRALRHRAIKMIREDSEIRALIEIEETS